MSKKKTTKEEPTGNIWPDCLPKGGVGFDYFNMCSFSKSKFDKTVDSGYLLKSTCSINKLMTYD